jgi:hypothetical protein
MSRGVEDFAYYIIIEDILMFFKNASPVAIG